MAMNVKGVVVQICKLESGESKQGKQWQKQEFVIETSEQYPKKVAFTVFGDKISLINGISEGQSVDVHFNLESRDFNGRWFHNINCWKIDVAASSAPTTGLIERDNQTQMPENEPDGNDLPF
jgi:hypothetical protein